jgi:hypothetical protein
MQRQGNTYGNKESKRSTLTSTKHKVGLDSDSSRLIWHAHVCLHVPWELVLCWLSDGYGGWVVECCWALFQKEAK